MKIAILGGAYDPPHLGHIIVAEQVLEIMKLDEVWLMPVYSHPFQKSLSPTSHRLAMTKLVETEKIKASDLEIKRNDTSYTIDTLGFLTKERPSDTFYWCIGSDTLDEFHKWKDWEKLIRDFRIIVYPRGSGLMNLRLHVKEVFKLDAIPENITVLDQEEVIVTNISSTLVRDRVTSNLSIKYIVPDTIEKYINTNKLYIKSS